MNSLVFLIFCFPIFGVALSGMPPDLKMLLGLDQANDVDTDAGGFKEEVRNDPDTLLDSTDLDFSRRLSQSKSIEEAKENLKTGNVKQYMPAPIKVIDCHVEFQVTKRIPGRCTKLPHSIPACQTEQYIGINYNECS